MTSADMYQENILDHYKNPHNFGTLPNPTATVKEYNPACGDTVEMQVRIESQIIADIRFHGNGCAISQAAMSMLTDEVKDKPLDFVKNLTKDSVFDLLGIEVSPFRIKCALLGLKALKVAVYQAEGKRYEE